MLALTALTGCSHSWEEYAPVDGPASSGTSSSSGSSSSTSGEGGAGASGGMTASSSSSSSGGSGGTTSVGGAGGVPVEGCQAPVFFDDFSGNLSKWQVDSGSWAIESGALAQTDPLAATTLIFATGDTNNLTDQRIQALTTLVAGDTSGAIELVARIDPASPGNRYWCAFQPSDGWLVIRVEANYVKVADIVEFQVDLTDTPGYVATDPHMMHFDVVGTQLHCWVDGVVGAEAIVSNGTYDKGTFGAKTYVKHARFDDFTVCP